MAALESYETLSSCTFDLRIRSQEVEPCFLIVFIKQFRSVNTIHNGIEKLRDRGTPIYEASPVKSLEFVDWSAVYLVKALDKASALKTVNSTHWNFDHFFSVWLL